MYSRGRSRGRRGFLSTRGKRAADWSPSSPKSNRGRGTSRGKDVTRNWSVQHEGSDGSASDLSSLSDLRLSGAFEAQDSSKHPNSLKRLYRDYLEVRKNPLVGVSVAPHPDDFFTWHGNALGPEGTPYAGGIFHFVIEFPQDYPNSPPTVIIKTRIEHPCVVGDRLQISFLDGCLEFVSSWMDRYSAWSPGFSAFSVILQIHAFLYDGTAEVALQNLSDLSEYVRKRQEWESAVQWSVEQSLRYNDPESMHRARKPWPPLPSSDEVVETALRSPNKVQLCKDRAVCYFTRRPADEVSLGMGITISKNIRNGRIQSACCVPYLLSLNAYNSQKIRRVWGHGFSSWLPIYVTETHGSRAVHMAKRCLSMLYKGSPTEFEPQMALDFYPKVLTYLVMRFVEEENAGAVCALEAFGHMYRMLIHFVGEFPDLVTTAKDQVDQFIKDPKARDKETTPSLGEFLIVLMLINKPFNEVSRIYLEESFDRHVYWIVKKFPELDKSDPDAKLDESRIKKSFSASVTGQRILLASLALAQTVSCCSESNELQDVGKFLDKRYGLLREDQIDELLMKKSEFLAIDSYMEFLSRVNVSVEEEELLDWLRQSVSRSAAKRYHGDKGIEVLSPEEFEKQRLGAIRPLTEMLVTSPDGVEHLHDNEDQWKLLCETRFGVSEAAVDLEKVHPWKHLYLQLNLQDLISKFNDNPDFKLLYQTLDLSAGDLTHFELMTFDPSNVKSGYHFLTAILTSLRKLAHLTICKGEVGLGQRGFKALVKGLEKSAGALQILDMRYSDITESCVGKLAESHLTSDRLSRLDLEGNPLDTAGATKLAQLMVKHRSLPNLAELNLRGCRISNAGVSALAEGLLVKRNIRLLDLSKNAFGSSGLAEVVKSLSYNPVLEELRLSELNLSKSGNSETDPLGTALTRLFQLTVSLRKISFWKTAVAGYFMTKNMEALGKNTTLVSLDLGSIGLCNTGPFAQALALKKSGLTELILDGNALTVDSLKTINDTFKFQKEKAPSPVQTLSLKGIANLRDRLDSEKHRKAMTTFFSHTMANLTSLDLSSCNLMANAGQVLGDILGMDPQLTNLNLSYNQLGKHGIRLLCTGLMTNTKLQVLRVDHNDIGTAGANHLSSVIQRPECRLQELHMFCNYVDVPGAQAIATAVTTNQHLKVLDIGMNRVRKGGTLAFVESLKWNSSLESLAMKFNYIPDAAAMRLVSTIVESPGNKVNRLLLAGNMISYATLVSIVSSLTKCSRSVSLDLAARAAYQDPERMERTVYCSPIAANVTPLMVKKLFYSHKCGAIRSVTIEKHRKKKAPYSQACYALVEFAHRDSVELALDVMVKGEARIGRGLSIRIVRAGLGAAAMMSAGNNESFVFL